MSLWLFGGRSEKIAWHSTPVSKARELPPGTTRWFQIMGIAKRGGHCLTGELNIKIFIKYLRSASDKLIETKKPSENLFISLQGTQSISWLVRPSVHLLGRIVFGDSPGINWILRGFAEAHNPSRSVSGTVCVFVPCCGKLNGNYNCILTN